MVFASWGSTITSEKFKDTSDMDLKLPDSLIPRDNTFKVLKSVSRDAPRLKTNYDGILGILTNKSLQRVIG